MLLHQLAYLLEFCLLFVCVVATDNTRSKRQIIFEDDDTRRNRYPEDADCITPNRESGYCVRLTSCQQLRRLSATANWNRLQPYICGFSGNEPRVCCPFEEEQPRVIPTRRPTTRRPTPTRRRITTTTTRRSVITTTTRRPVITTTTRRPVITTTRRPQPENLTRPSFLPKRCGIPKTIDNRIVGGKEANAGDWPWMAVVYVEKRNGAMSPDCGGALVTNRHVITAAHCVVTGRTSTTMSPRQLSVRLGAHNLRNQNEPSAMNVGVDAVRRHERFDPRTYRNDIAVLRLSRNVSFTERIAPVCVPYDSLRDNDLQEKRGTVIGFGTTAFNGPSSDVLRQATFHIQSQEVCRKAYEREVNITRVYLCAGMDSGAKDSCQGDSGGPLMSIGAGGNYYLVGIVSFGKLCGQPGYPGVYTRVTEFLDWLTRNLAD